MSKKKENENQAVEENIDGISYSADSIIATDDAILQIDLLPDDLEEVDEFKEDVAYISGSYFYVYRGVGNPATKEYKKPGIYKNKDGDDPKWFIVEPSTDEEKKEYEHITKVCTLHPVSIVDTANTTEELLVAIPESTKIFQPQITEKDDILKIAAKKALLAKNVDLDRYKDRFSNKNELFNFKQVLRGDNKLSMKIFTRGMDALNLEFVIIIREKSTNDIVGDKLDEDIEISSEETYPL